MDHGVSAMLWTFLHGPSKVVSVGPRPSRSVGRVHHVMGAEVSTDAVKREVTTPQSARKETWEPCIDGGFVRVEIGPPAAGDSAHAGLPQSILILHNVSKKKNFGELLRTAAAMGVCEVVIVGAQKLATFGAHGTVGHLRFSHFSKLADAVAYVRNVRCAKLCGVEITSDALPVQAHPFQGTTAFLMGNEGAGLLPVQLAVCDQFVYIPQHSAATASLNVNAACAVVLHHFAQWAALPEAPRDGFKFVEESPPSSTPNSGMGLKQMRTLTADGSIAPRATDASASAGNGDDDEGADFDFNEVMGDDARDS